MFPEDAGIPVMMAGSVQLPGLSQLTLSVVAVLDVGALLWGSLPDLCCAVAGDSSPRNYYLRWGLLCGSSA